MQSPVDKDVTYRSIWKTAWPVMATLSSYLIFETVDMIWIGCLGTDALAGASVGGAFMLLLFMFGRVVSTGTMSLVARFHGADDQTEVSRTVGNAFFLSLIVGTVEIIVLNSLIEHIVPLFGLEAPVAAAAGQYLEVIIYGAPFWYITETTFAFFNGMGRTRAPMVTAFYACLLNAVLDPLLLFGWYGFPRLGVAGAAYATVIASVFEMIVALLIYKKAQGLELPTIVGQRLWKILSIGLPSSLRDISFPLVDIFMFSIVANYGSAAVAAYGVGRRVVGLMIIYVVGLSVALSALAGQQIGANRPEKAHAILIKTLLLAFAFHSIFTFLVILSPDTIISCFSRDESVAAIARPMLYILSCVLYLNICGQCLTSMFQAAGKTRIVFVSAVVGQWLLLLPMAFCLAKYSCNINWVWLSFGLARSVELALLWKAYKEYQETTTACS